MKVINQINLFVFFLPILCLATYPIYDDGAFAFALLTLMITGFTQIILGIVMLFKNPKNHFLQVYIALVIVFFVSFTLLINEFDNGDYVFKYYGVFAILLAIYLSVIIYSKYNSNNSFLTAEWNDLAIINYEISPDILDDYVPIGTELDLWNGKCYISLIGFMFEKVSILGFKIPFYTNFEEVNLRFYVKRFEDGIWKRGVVFIKEIVPKHAITVVANTLYKEHYQTLKMNHQRTENENSKSFSYAWKKGSKWSSLSVQTAKKPIDIDVNSEAEFITEHYFGYTKFSKTKTIEYEVTHPRWKQYEVIEHQIDVDFENIYGKDFLFLEYLKPSSAFLALGSPITIEGKKTIQ